MAGLLITIFSSIAAWLTGCGSAFVSMFVTLGLAYLAFKAIMFLLFGVGLPLILYNLFTYYQKDILVFILGLLKVTSHLVPLTLQLI